MLVLVTRPHRQALVVVPVESHHTCQQATLGYLRSLKAFCLRQQFPQAQRGRECQSSQCVPQGPRDQRHKPNSRPKRIVKPSAKVSGPLWEA